MRIVLLITTLVILSLPSARAEYRAYELKIENTETNKGRTEISTLDHLQYPRYFPLAAGEKISYVDSWMCRGNTSNFKKPCAKPIRAAASTTAASPKTSK